MKITDYYTFASFTGKKIPYRLNILAIDPECEVFCLDENKVIAIYDTFKFVGSEKNNGHYAMHLIGKNEDKPIKYSDSKEELIRYYSRLITARIVEPKRSCLNAEEKIQKEFRKIERTEKTIENEPEI